MTSIQTLPEPSADAQAHSQRVHKHICRLIDTHGPLTFHDYMQAALYSPSLGYYSAGSTKFGSAGDFTTAPELSPLFGRSIAKQCVEVFHTMDSPTILELGAGSGALAISLLQELQGSNQLPDHYYILDVSADCRQRQQHRFQQQAPELLSRVTWLDRLPEKPIQGIILANEVLDAMPVHKFRYMPNQLDEYHVTHHHETLTWEILPCTNTVLNRAITHLNIQSNQPYHSEINLALPSWIKHLSQCLSQGLILLIDYGFPRREFYFPERHMGTLMCHYQHRAHDNPLVFPGIQDITAHVDFTAVAEAAFDNGLTVAGYTHQAAFLASCGIHDLIQQESSNNTSNIHTLLHPSEMGELFKCIALTRQIDHPLLGFRLLNQVERL